MSREVFALPDLGEGLTEAHLVRWLVAVGDEVAIDAPVAEVETAKSAVELPSPYAGVVATLHGVEGDVVAVGAPLLSVDAGDAAADAYVEGEQAGSGNVLVGYGTADAPTPRRRRVRRPEVVEAPIGPRVRSPLVRRLARQRGVDLAAVAATGPDGHITRADVERAAPTPPADEAPNDRRAEPPAGVDRRTGLPIRGRVALSGVRGAVAQAMSRSRREIPEATTWVDVDVTDLLKLREAMAREGGRPPGLLALLARFTVSALARFPELNARVDGDAVLHLDGVHLGIATQTERGLLVPAVRDAHRLGIGALDAEIRRVTAAARDGAVEPGAGSFTLNNYGVLGVDGSAAIINHPEVAILGIGRVLERPWVVGGQVVARRIAQLSLVFDHRVGDGAAAGGFLRAVADALEHPLPALADL